MNNRHLGSSFDDFLREEGIFEEVEAQAIKRVIVWQIEQAIEVQGLTRTQVAELMSTSRAQVNRLLDPENTSVTLHTMQRVAAVLGKRLQISLEDRS